MTGIDGEASGTFEVAQAPLISPFKFLGPRRAAPDSAGQTGSGRDSRTYKVARAIMTGIGGTASGAMKPIVVAISRYWRG